MGHFQHDERVSGGPLIEYDTVGCRHCHAVMPTPEWQRRGGWCQRCFGPLCLPCADAANRTTEHVPYMQRIERAHDRAQRRRT